MFAEKFQSVPDSPGELSLLKISVSCISRSDVWPGTLCLNIYLKSLIQMVPKQLPWLHSQIHTSTSHFLTPVNPVSLLDLSCSNDSCIKSDLTQSAGNLLPSWKVLSLSSATDNGSTVRQMCLLCVFAYRWADKLVRLHLKPRVSNWHHWASSPEKWDPTWQLQLESPARSTWKCQACARLPRIWQVEGLEEGDHGRTRPCGGYSSLFSLTVMCMHTLYYE